MIIFSVNYAAVLVAALFGYALGGLWYSRPLFGPAYLAALGKKREELASRAPALIATAFTTLATAWSLAVVLASINIQSALGGVWVGILVGGGVMAMTMRSDYLFANWPPRLFWIQAGYRGLQIVLMAAILGAWQ